MEFIIIYILLGVLTSAGIITNKVLDGYDIKKAKEEDNLVIFNITFFWPLVLLIIIIRSLGLWIGNKLKERKDRRSRRVLNK